MNILFLCTGNSCRSILGEAIFNHLAPTGWLAMSSGSSPTGFVHPESLSLLNKKGINTEGLYSKSWDDLPVTPDIVITVCAAAAEETCPVYLGKAIRTHWGLEDPAKVENKEVALHMFEQTFNTLYEGITALLSLPLNTLVDRKALKHELDVIGQNFFNSKIQLFNDSTIDKIMKINIKNHLGS